MANSPATNVSGANSFSITDTLDRLADERLNSNTGSKSLNRAVAQVLTLTSSVAKAVVGKAEVGTEKPTIMSRVKSGFLAVAALGPAIGNVAVRAAGKGIDKLVDKHPVLAMAVGIAGLIGGIALATHEPFTGIALTTAAAYTILKSYKPVHEKLMKALGKSEASPSEEGKQALEVKTDSSVEVNTGSVESENEPKFITV